MAKAGTQASRVKAVLAGCGIIASGYLLTYWFWASMSGDGDVQWLDGLRSTIEHFLSWFALA